MAHIKAGGLRDRFDAIVLPSAGKEPLLKGVTGEWNRPEHRGGLGAEGVKALKDFVRQGGTLIALGNSSLLPIEEFPLPLRNAFKDLKQGQFSVRVRLADSVTRGQVSIFVERGGFNQLLWPTTPILVSVSPATGSAGQNIPVTIKSTGGEAGSGRVPRGSKR